MLSRRRLLLAASMLSLSFLAEIAPASAAAGLANTTVLIVRHAEKPDDGPGLAPMGEKRAAAYAGYFQNLTVDGRSLRPQTLIATADSRESLRPGLTLKPVAAALGLPLDQRFKDKDYAGVVQALQNESHGAVVLIAWHHGKLDKMLAAFGADPRTLLPAGKWPEDIYDWLFILPFDAQGQLLAAQVKRVTETDLDHAIGATPSGN
ncbi:MAG TPA: flagellar basal body-associated protein FliL [Terriglobia bacterium]|nr:flagellar basal body-associated protein FliL [Terriglobia bacterium]